MTVPTTADRLRGWFTADSPDLDEFRAVVDQTTHLDDYPYAESVQSNVLVYGEHLRELAAQQDTRHEIQAELARALLDGPGIVVFKGAFADRDLVDRVTRVFQAMIEQQKRDGTSAGDHFAKPGANDRVWGALDKFAVRAPELFLDYYSNDVLALVSQAWLGPNYQVTSQVNVVNPGGDAQTAHRDYHLGFMPLDEAVRYPAHVHELSATLTLQGAVAHCDMPVETGPTMYLPHSQKYRAGYVAFHVPQFIEYFEKHHVQLPLEKGDAAFFNPALFHGAGSNRSADVKRMANLLQISSAFGRAMESVDHVAMVKALFPLLTARRAAGADESGLRNVVAASAEGYPFPTDLDQDQPVGGLLPPTQADLLWRAVCEDWPADRLAKEVDAQAARRRPRRG